MTDDEQKSPRPEQQLLFPDMVSEYRGGKDELNLAEFPIAALSNRVSSDTKTIVFEDTTHDKAAGQMITRRLTITAGDAYGLPTSSDDEVLLGLLQITRQQGFKSPWVHFNIHQLLKVLGWGIHGKNYQRVHDAINRWVGVTLYYDNAWRDKATNKWVDQKFHFLENAELYTRGASMIGADGVSCIKWNDRVFQSFQSGNLKSLDFEVFRRLKSTTSKRMFRFLDKRFYYRSSLTFDLERFAFDKLGLPRSYTDIGQIKRRIKEGIEELELVGFLVPMKANERFTKSRIGIWEVHFEKAGRAEKEAEQPLLAIEAEDISPTEGRLIGHGVTKSQARKVVSEFEDSLITSHLDALEYILSDEKKPHPENRGGWLVKAISENYTLPKGFKSQAQREQEALDKAERAKARNEARLQKEARDKAREEVKEEATQERFGRAEAYLATLTEEARGKIERDALHGTPLATGRLDSPFRRSWILSYVLQRLDENAKKEPRSEA